MDLTVTELNRRNPIDVLVQHAIPVAVLIGGFADGRSELAFVRFRSAIDEAALGFVAIAITADYVDIVIPAAVWRVPGDVPIRTSMERAGYAEAISVILVVVTAASRLAFDAFAGFVIAAHHVFRFVIIGAFVHRLFLSLRLADSCFFGYYNRLGANISGP